MICRVMAPAALFLVGCLMQGCSLHPKVPNIQCESDTLVIKDHIYVSESGQLFDRVQKGAESRVVFTGKYRIQYGDYMYNPNQLFFEVYYNGRRDSTSPEQILVGDSVVQGGQKARHCYDSIARHIKVLGGVFVK